MNITRLLKDADRQPRCSTLRVMALLALLIGVSTSLDTLAADPCGNLFQGKVPPRDYRDLSNREHLSMVQHRHFTPRVENLIRGESTSDVMPDIDYTLNHYPNHHRALMALVRYDDKLNGRLPKVPGSASEQSVECYFKRAFQFKPDDAKLNQLYGIYFFKKSEYEKALEQFQQADSKRPSTEIDYNLGLTYLELDDLKKAKVYAEKAYEANFPLTGLKRKLEEQGVKLSTTSSSGQPETGQTETGE